MKLAVITPLHEAGNKFVRDAYRSLLAQSWQGWRWVVVENAGGRLPDDVRADERVTVVDGSARAGSVGALKALASFATAAELLVELDCDDELMPTALERVLAAFDSGADVVFSDFAEWRELEGGAFEREWQHYPYGERYGWRRYEVTDPYRQRALWAMEAPEATAHNLRLVDWSPNHVRAWRRGVYEEVGGHDVSMPVADDHDLMVRLYLAGARFRRVPECLYLYRVHGANTVGARNAEIRDGTWGVYNRSVWRLAEKWAADRALSRVDLCGGVDRPEGYLGLDRVVSPEELRSGRALPCDLDRQWPLPDGSVGVLRAHDAVEHLVDPVHTLNEAYRVLAPGGWLMVHVPSTNGLGAFCDPTHRSFWNLLSFRYYCLPEFRRYVPGFRGEFQCVKLIEWFPSAWHREQNVPYVEAHLVRLGEGYRPMGALHP